MRIEAFVRDAFSIRAMVGTQWNVPCPFHGDTHKRHLYISADSGLWICFRCDEKGSFRKLVWKIAKTDSSIKPSEYLDAEDDGEKDLLRSFGASIKGSGVSTDDVEFPEHTYAVWKRISGVSELIRAKAIKYLIKRGISPGNMMLYDLHFCAAGTYRNRILVPVYHEDTGQRVGWVARDFTGEADRKILSSTTHAGGPSVDATLLNLHLAKGRFEEVVLVEGPFDAMKHGPTFLALFGKKLKDSQFHSLVAARFKKVTILLDADVDVRKDSYALRDSLKMHIPEVRVARLVKSKDPGEAGAEEIAQALANAS